MKTNTRFLPAIAVMLMLAAALMPFFAVAESDDSDAAAPTGTYYLDQLTAGGKADTVLIYNKIKTAAESLDTDVGLTYTEFSENDYPKVDVVETAFYAYMYDHPETFWMKSNHSLSFKAGTSDRVTTITLSFTAADAAEKDAQQAQIDAKVNSIVVDAEFTYGKVRQIHDWIVNNTVYDTLAVSDLEAYNAHNIYGPFAEGKCVCEGYAKAFKYLCDRNGIETINTIGIGKNSTGSESHMWNYVKMDDGKWYCMDVTWDDPLVNGSDSGKVYYDYFLRGYDSKVSDMTFAESHVVDLSVTMSSKKVTLGLSMPPLSPDDYRFRPDHEHQNIQVETSESSYTVQVSDIPSMREQMGPDGSITFETENMSFMFTCDDLKNVKTKLDSEGVSSFTLGCTVGKADVKAFNYDFLKSIDAIYGYKKELKTFTPAISTGDVSSLGLTKMTVGLRTEMSALDLNIFMYGWDVSSPENPQKIKADYIDGYETFEISALGTYCAGNNPITPAIDIPFVVLIGAIVLGILIILFLIKSILRRRKVKKLAKKMARSKKNMEHYKALYQDNKLTNVERDAYLKAREIRKKNE